MGWEVKWEAREEISRGHHLIDKTYLWAHTEDTHWKYHREKCGQEERLLDSEWSYNMGWVRFLNIRVLTITGPYIKLRIQTKKNILLRCKRRGSNIIHGRENSHISSFTPHHCPPMRIFSFTLVWIFKWEDTEAHLRSRWPSEDLHLSLTSHLVHPTLCPKDSICATTKE